MENQLPLRDIHLPSPNSWWPPAPGWWMLLLLLIVVMVLIWWFRKKYRQRAIIRSALNQLKNIHNSFKQSKNSQLLLSELSELTRRVMISHYHREDVSSLIGDAWLERLDQELDSRDFRAGIGSVLARGPYQQRVEFDEAKLIGLVKRLILKVLTPAWIGRWRRENG